MNLDTFKTIVRMDISVLIDQIGLANFWGGQIAAKKRMKTGKLFETQRRSDEERHDQCLKV